jgi:glycosyltransferase involved in cell wall biosynthesis
MPPGTATPIAFVAAEPGGPDGSCELRSLATALPSGWRPVLWPSAAPGALSARAMAAARAMRAAGVGLLHIDAAAAAPPFVAAARWLGRPCVVRVAGVLARGGLPRWGLALSDAVVFDTEAARDAAGWRTGWVVPRGVDPPAAIDTEAARRALGALPGEVIVAQLGPLAPLQGCDLALEAVAILRRRSLPVRLALVGDDRQWEGRYRDVLRSLAMGLGMNDQLTIVGEHPAGASLLRGADVLVCPARAGSDLRGIPAALAAAVPVVATRVGAAAEWVHEGQEGLLIAPEDPGELVGALQRLVLDASLRRELGARGAQRASAEFSWEACARRMAALYRAVCTPYLQADAPVGPRTPPPRRPPPWSGDTPGETR